MSLEGSRPGTERGSHGWLAGVLVLAAAIMGVEVWRAEYFGLFGTALLAAVAVVALLRRGGAWVRPAPAPRTDAGPARALVAALPAPVVLVDRRVVVVEANLAARAIAPGLRSGQPLAFALRAPEVLDGIRDVLAAGTGRDVELAGRGPTDRAYEVHIRPLAPGAAGTAAALLVFRDLTAERRLETMRSDFIATVSHELRTPLASLSGFIDTLAGPAREDRAAREKFLGIMRAQADRMTRLVDDLLRLSRVELNAHHAPETPIGFEPLVRHMVEILTPLARERQVEIAVEVQAPAPVSAPAPALAPGGELPVLGDRDELLRVVENLVENAIKYGGSGGRVEVSLAPREDGRRWVELSVRDHGPGIAPEHIPRLTERFYRVDVAESRREGGTGLGLAIVKHIVNRHRGRLWIESAPGEGMRVTVRLPAAG